MTQVQYIEIEGNKINKDILSILKATAFCQAVISSDFSKLLSAIKKDNGNEVIIFETEIEVGQYPLNDIRGFERIAVEFQAKDKEMPKVYTLREDFPSLPHQYLELNEKPRSLCLYEMPYEEIKIFWTGFLFLQRIREWLNLSAKGELHQNDQPLEPLLIGEKGTVLFPNGIKPGDEVFIYTLTSDYYGRINLFISKEERQINYPRLEAKLEIIIGTPQMHGIFRKAPLNMGELANFISKADIDLSTYLKDKLLGYKDQNVDINKKLLLFIRLPKIRNTGELPQIIDNYVFLSSDSIEQIGIKLGLWEKVDSKLDLGIVLNPNITDEALSQCPIDILKPVFEFTRPVAKWMNGIKSDTNPQIVAVGMGALGSQFFLNLIRAGFGKWTTVDSDTFYPHNLSRHVLFGEDMLGNKVYQVAHRATSILNEPGLVTPLLLDVINDRENKVLNEKIIAADYIIDLSASSSVLKVLSEFKTNARVVSFFVSPTGEDLVVLAEDSLKTVSIRQLEIQYLRAILNTEKLHSHFSTNDKIRYSTGCRDISSNVPQDSIALAAALSSKVMKQLTTNTDALISIWQSNATDLGIERHNFKVSKTVESQIGDWVLIYDEYFINKVYDLRASRLPNETGGILLGNYDMERKHIYIADVIHSPEDSIEYPTAYIRGIKNIDRELQKVKDITAGTIQYIGEWHTHPDGYSSRPSEDDIILLSWLHEHMYKEGVPAIMFIAGEKLDFNFYLAEYFVSKK